MTWIEEFADMLLKKMALFGRREWAGNQLFFVVSGGM